MTKYPPIYLVFVFCLCAPLLMAAQDKEAYRTNLEQATQLARKIEQAVKAKEPKWKIKESDGGTGFQGPDDLKPEVWFYQDWQSGAGKVHLTVYVYFSDEQASNWQKRRSNWSSVTGSSELKGFGDEAYYIDHRYFRWMSVRRGRIVVDVNGPGGASTVTRRFTEWGLAQIEDH
jgi:hypothetical protein